MQAQGAPSNDMKSTASAYLQRKRASIETLFSELVKQMLVEQPDDTRAFIMQHLSAGGTAETRATAEEPNASKPKAVADALFSTTTDAGNDEHLSQAADCESDIAGTNAGELGWSDSVCRLLGLAREELKSAERNDPSDAAALELASDGAAAAVGAASESAQPQDSVAWEAATWLESLPEVNACIAAALTRPLRGDKSLELPFVRAIGSHGAEADVLDLLRRGGLLEHLASLVFSACAKLSTAVAHTSSEYQAKFADGFQLAYGGLELFFGGLDDLIGAPSPKLRSAMVREHCGSEDSKKFFSTGNYGLHTTSEIEWWFVANPERGLTALGISEWPVEEKLRHDPERAAHCRTPKPLAELADTVCDINQRLRDAGNAPITHEEVIGARAYTGPLFVKYNTSLRAAAPNMPAFMKADFDRLCLGNLYTTTLHVVNSALVKLGSLTKACSVYRGLSGGLLPNAFLPIADNAMWSEYNVCGGVEPAFMSTTKDRAVALAYAAGTPGKAGIVFEMKLGMVDRGADLGWCSQYPHEEEICFGPLTGLEVIKTKVEKSVMVMEVHPSSNLKALTIEKVIAKRFAMVDGMCKNEKDELARVVGEGGWEGARALVHDTGDEHDARTLVRQFTTAILDDTTSAILMNEAGWFNVDKQLGAAILGLVDATSALNGWPAGLEAILRWPQAMVSRVALVTEEAPETAPAFFDANGLPLPGQKQSRDRLLTVKFAGGTKVGSDAGSGAKMDLNYFAPSEVPDGWLMVGHGSMADNLVIVKGEAVRPNTDWVQVWTDKGSGKPRDYAVWMPTCGDDDYVALGVVCVMGTHGVEKPSCRVGMVHKSCCEPAALGAVAWKDSGTRAQHDLTLKLAVWSGVELCLLWPSVATLMGQGPPPPSQIAAAWLPTASNGKAPAVGPLVHAKYVSGVRVGSDEGSHAQLGMTLYAPASDVGDDWLMLGHSTAASNVLVVERSPLVRACDGWAPVWTDQGSGNPSKQAVWVPTCSDPDFVALGVVCTMREGAAGAADGGVNGGVRGGVNGGGDEGSWTPPSVAVGMLHASCCERAQLGQMAWGDNGTSGAYDVTLNHLVWSGGATVNLMWPSVATLMGHTPPSPHCIREASMQAAADPASTINRLKMASELHLGDCGISDEMVGPLALLTKHSAKLTKLDLSSNKLGLQSARAIAQALFGNTVVTDLNVSSNAFGPAAGKTFAQLLKMNSCLQVLNVSDCSLGVTGESAIVDALQANTSLQTLNLRGLPMPVDAVKAGRSLDAPVLTKYVPGVLAGSDAGSGARLSLSYYAPASLPDGWLMVGHGSMADNLVIVKGEAVRPNTDWVQVWTDKGSGKPRDYAVWMPTCGDDDYVALGVVCVMGTQGVEKPSCTVGMVHVSCCDTVSLAAEPIWKDAGTRANEDLWLSVPVVGGSAVNVMWPSVATLMGRTPPPRWVKDDASLAAVEFTAADAAAGRLAAREVQAKQSGGTSQVQWRRVRGVVAGSDAGCGARLDLNYFEPCEVPEGWLSVGHGSKPDNLIIVQGEAVRPNTDWVQVWTDKGSGKVRDYAVWMPTCGDDDYVALGVACVMGTHGVRKPSCTIGMVRRSCCEPTVLGAIAWRDAGTRAHHDLTLNTVDWAGAESSLLWPSVATLIGTPPPPLQITNE